MIQALLRPDDRAAWLAAGTLSLGLVLGGGGSPAPLAEAALQVATAVLVFAWFAAYGGARPAIPRAALAIAALLILLPLVQLVPLPPFVWQVLPGRALEAEALGLVGRSNEWRALSLDAPRTLAALLAVLPAAAMLVMTSTLDLAGRRRVVAVLALAALATMVLGAAQVSQGADSPLRFYGPGAAFLEGFQANHNSTADVLLIGLVAGIAAVRTSALARGGLPNRRAAVLSLAAIVTLVLGLGVFLTASRMGAALLPAALIAAVLLLRPWLPLNRRTLAGAVAVLVSAAALGGVLLARSDAVGRVADRYTLSGELRPNLWRDSLYAARSHFPAGVGMGNFVPALLAGERLEVVRPSVPNRAHNDYLELLVEAGLLGLAALGAIGAILAREGVRALRQRNAEARAAAIVGTAALTILALHSLVDYPLRSMSIAMAAAACAGLILSSRVATADRHESGRVEHES